MILGMKLLLCIHVYDIRLYLYVLFELDENSDCYDRVKFSRHYELVSRLNVGLKSLLHQGLSEPEFYGD